MIEVAKKAEKFAKKMQNGQKKWTGEPSINHAEKIANCPGIKCLGENFIATAWLHEVIEDKQCTITDLEKHGFPNEVVNAINDITHKYNETYLETLLRIKKNDIAAMVKLADIHDDMKRIKPGHVKDKFLMSLYILRI